MSLADCPKTISCDPGSRDGSWWVHRSSASEVSKDLVECQHLLRGAVKP